MLLLICILFSLIATFLSCYLGQFLINGKIIIWSIPIFLLAYLLLAVVIFLIFVSIVNALMRPSVDKKPNKFHTEITKLAAQFVLTVSNCKVVIRNKELLPTNRPFLMVSNHQSNMDPVAFIYAFRNINCTFVMKNDLMHFPILGKWLYGAGFLPLDRHNDRKALETISLAIKRIKNNVHSIAIYPEGTRSKGTIVNHFHNGTFKIAQKAQCPIVLVAMDNAYKVKYRSPFIPTKIYCEIVEVMEYESFKDMNTAEMSDYAKKRIEETLEKRRKEIDWLQPKEKYLKAQKILD